MNSKVTLRVDAGSLNPAFADLVMNPVLGTEGAQTDEAGESGLYSRTPTPPPPSSRRGKLESCVERVSGRNDAAQTIVLEAVEGSEGGGAPGVRLHVVMLIDVLQVGALLATVPRREGSSSNSNSSGAAPEVVFDHYVGDVVDACVGQCERGDLPGCRLSSVYAHVLVVPDVAAATAGLNAGRNSIPARDVARLYTSALCHCVRRRQEQALARGGAAPAVLLGVCFCASDCAEAAAVVNALAAKLAESLASAGRAEDGLTAAQRHLRPEGSAKKVDPLDFQQVYKQMLLEVDSFSDRKVVSTMSSFPTMRALLEHIIAIGGADGVGCASCPVANYGETRRYNVLSEELLRSLCVDFPFDE